MSADRSAENLPRVPPASLGLARADNRLPVPAPRIRPEGLLRQSLGDDPDVIIVEYLPDGTLRWASESLRRVLGWDPDRVVGTRWRPTPPQWQERAVRVFSYALARRIQYLQAQMPALRQDGTVVCARTTAYFMWRPDGTLGSVVARIEVLTDPVTLEQLRCEQHGGDSGAGPPGE